MSGLVQYPYLELTCPGFAQSTVKFPEVAQHAGTQLKCQNTLKSFIVQFQLCERRSVVRWGIFAQIGLATQSENYLLNNEGFPPPPVLPRKGKCLVATICSSGRSAWAQLPVVCGLPSRRGATEQPASRFPHRHTPSRDPPPSCGCPFPEQRKLLLLLPAAVCAGPQTPLHRLCHGPAALCGQSRLALPGGADASSAHGGSFAGRIPSS